jgi:hypothetical protein
MLTESKRPQLTRCRASLLAVAGGMIYGFAGNSVASDHLDTPTVIANPQADIGDVFAWTSPNGRQLNLIMTIVGHSFSDRIQYVLHVDSGKQFGRTTASTSIVCRFQASSLVDCKAGTADSARGDASNPEGLQGRNHRFRVFAGPRDDPFFNNVRGTRAAYQVAAKALHNGTAVDAAGCPAFDHATSASIFEEWRHTDHGPPKNFLAGWQSSALVISIDLDVVAKGGKILAIWGTTVSHGEQLDRAARPLTGNALLGTLATEEVSNELKEAYNAASPATSARFIPEIEQGLALYDAFDGRCGNQLLADKDAKPAARYQRLATVLADDRLWVNGESTVCTQFFAVEFASLAGQSSFSQDCGGRTPLYNAANIYRSILVDGTVGSVSDGLDHDELEHSATVFPFLAAADATPGAKP